MGSQAKTHSHIDPTFGTETYIGRELTTHIFSLRSEGFGSNISHPYFYNIHLRDGMPKHLALKANVTCIHETHRLQQINSS